MSTKILQVLVFCLLCCCAIETGSSRKSDVPVDLDSFSQGGSKPEVCKDGEKRTCHVTLGNHEGIQSCFVGVQFCESDEWTPCVEGVVD